MHAFNSVQGSQTLRAAGAAPEVGKVVDMFCFSLRVEVHSAHSEFRLRGWDKAKGVSTLTSWKKQRASKECVFCYVDARCWPRQQRIGSSLHKQGHMKRSAVPGCSNKHCIVGGVGVHT